MKKRIVSAIVLLALVLSIALPALAEEVTYAAVVDGVGYASVQEAVNAANGKLVTLQADSQETVSAQGDLYLDLNGHSLSKVTVSGTLYGMDSATIEYASSGAKIETVEGTYASNYRHTDAKRYLAVAEGEGVSFHRFYMGITNISLKPAVTGFGYKAEFYGDEAVQAKIASIGYKLWLTENAVVSRSINNFKNTLTLRLQNFDVENYGEADVHSAVFMTLADGTVIDSEAVAYDFRQVVELINASFDSYSYSKKLAVQAMCESYDTIKNNWNVANILNWYEEPVFDTTDGKNSWDLDNQFNGSVTLVSKGTDDAYVETAKATYREAAIHVKDATQDGKFEMQLRFYFTNGNKYQVRMYYKESADQYEIQTMDGIVNWLWIKNLSSAQAEKLRSEGVEFRAKIVGTKVELYVDDVLMAHSSAARHDLSAGIDDSTTAKVRFHMVGNSGAENLVLPFELKEFTTVTIPTFEGGKVTSDKAGYMAGETVTLTVTPNAGYCSQSISVSNGNTDVALDGTFQVMGNSYTFVAEEGTTNYTVSAEFIPAIIGSTDSKNKWDLNNQYNGSATLVSKGTDDAYLETAADIYREAAIHVKDATQDGKFEMQLRFYFTNGNKYQVRMYYNAGANNGAGQYEIQTMDGIVNWKWIKNLTTAQAEKLCSEGVEFRAKIVGTKMELYVDDVVMAHSDAARHDLSSGIDVNTTAKIRFHMVGNSGAENLILPFEVKIPPVFGSTDTANSWDLTNQHNGSVTLVSKGTSDAFVRTEGNIYREAAIHVKDATQDGKFEMQLRFFFTNGTKYQVRLYYKASADQYEIQTMDGIINWLWIKNLSTAQAEKLKSEGVEFRARIVGTKVELYVDDVLMANSNAARHDLSAGIDETTTAQIQFHMVGNSGAENLVMPFEVLTAPVFTSNYDKAVWDVSGQRDGYVTVMGGGGSGKLLQFANTYQNVDITVNARDYADSEKKSRTDVLFQFDVDGDGAIDTAKGDQTLSFGVAEGIRVQTMDTTLLWWKTPYDLSEADLAQYVIDEAEVAAGNEDGLDLRIIRYGTMMYIFVEDRQVAYHDLTLCGNANGDTASGITADTKMFVSLRHYDDARQDGVVIPFSITEEVTPVAVSVSAGENGTAHAGYVNYFVNNVRNSKLSDTHFAGENVVLTVTPASEDYACSQLLVNDKDQSANLTVDAEGVGQYAFTASAASYSIEAAFAERIFENDYDAAYWDLSKQYQGIITMPNGGGATASPLQLKGQYTDVAVDLVVRDYADEAGTEARTDVGFEFENGETVTFGVIHTLGTYRIQTREGTLLTWKTPYTITDQELMDAYDVTAEEMASGELGGLNFRVVRYGTEFYLYLNDEMVKGYDFSYDIAADTPVKVYLRHYDDAGVKVEIPFAITEDVSIDQLRLFTEKEPVTDYAYSFAVIPDTQVVMENDVVNGETNMAKLFDWIVANKESKNIQHVFGLGDITENNNTEEWTIAQTQYEKLMTAGIPYSAVRGNHDLKWYGKEEGSEAQTTDDYTNYMGTDAYRAQFGGFYSETNIANSWRTLQVGNVKYLLITLDYGANDAILNWASGIIYQHPDHNVIITTHAYLFRDGTTLDDGDVVPPSTTGGSNDGDDMWEKLVSKHENIVLVMCGHDPEENIIVNRSVGDNGNTVTAMLLDAQGVEAQEGSMGMVALLHFSADGKTVQVEYYSTSKEKYFKAENQFSLELDVVGETVSSEIPATGAYTNTALTEGSAYTTTIADEQKITLSKTPYTVSAWINLSTSVKDAAGVIIGNYSGSYANCLNIEISTNGNPRLYHRNANNVYDSLIFNQVDIRSDTNWVHLVFTISGNRVSCYVNGELKQTLIAANTIQLESTNADFVIGGDLRDGNARAFKGRILNLDLYSGILSAEKIQSLYVNGAEAAIAGKIEY